MTKPFYTNWSEPTLDLAFRIWDECASKTTGPQRQFLSDVFGGVNVADFSENYIENFIMLAGEVLNEV